MTRIWKVGTRKSRLAQIQTDRVIQRLTAVFPEIECQKVFITTKGDADQTTSLTQMGGQGVFVKKIQHELLAGTIDFAVHSAKDLPSVEPEELTLAAFPERGAVEDCLLTLHGQTLEHLPNGARVGTSSLRRQFQILNVRPDLQVVSLRGNIDTRIQKLLAGDYDAIVMAKAGLDRYDLELSQRGITENLLPLPDFLPAVSQGAIAVECVAGSEIAQLLEAIDDPIVRQAVTCERAFLSVFGAGCNVPIAAYAQAAAEGIHLQAMLGDLDTQQGYMIEDTGMEPIALGTRIADTLRKKADM